MCSSVFLDFSIFSLGSFSFHLKYSFNKDLWIENSFTCMPEHVYIAFNLEYQ